MLQHHGRQLGARRDLGPVTPVNTKAIARRVVRYHGLNPLWAGLVDDPLSWAFSTLRDGVGAVADPWVSPARLEHSLSWRPAAMHRFVVSDAACGPATRRRMQRLSPGGAAVGLGAIIDACAASLRAEPADLRRRGHSMRPTFLGLARRCGTSTSGFADFIARGHGRRPPDSSNPDLPVACPRTGAYGMKLRHAALSRNRMGSIIMI